MSKITLWTRQDTRFIDAINKNGFYIAKKEYIQEKNQELSPYFLKLYDWFVHEAEKYVPRPANAQYPIWCSVTDEYMLRGAHGNILIKLSIDEEKIVYFDSPKWDLVINHNYIAKDAQDQKKFDNYLAQRGLSNSFALLDDYHKKFYPDVAKKVIESWKRIFEIEKSDNTIFSIQANIWEIRPEDIIEIREGEDEKLVKGVLIFETLKPD